VLLPLVCKIFKELGLILESSDVKSGAGHVLTIKCGSGKDYEYHERSLYYPLQDIEAYTIMLAVGVGVSRCRFISLAQESRNQVKQPGFLSFTDIPKDNLTTI
jgi:hypothetical protein